MTGHWIAVASAEHVQRGRMGGFMQVCHGKAAPLRRIKPEDGVIYYSPSVAFGGKDRLQAFTALGVVQEGEPYCFDMGNGFRPYRRNVLWAQAKEIRIHPLLDSLEFTRGRSNWGYQFRLGLLSISACDFHLIASAMQCETRAAGQEPF